MANPVRVLVVEDEPAIADTVIYALKTEGFEVEWCATGGEALRLMVERPVGFIVLDLGLPDMNGLDVCREVRRTSAVPILFLTSRASEIDRIVGLELGGDDYMAKPFSPRELTARVRAILRRGAASHPNDQERPTTGERSPRATVMPFWEHDAGRCRIRYRGQALELTRNEYRLLAVMIASPGRVFTRPQLMDAAWEDPGSATDRTIDAHVKSVRAKLRQVAPADDPVQTHRGLGYSIREGA